jgi:hypothetical protein
VELSSSIAVLYKEKMTELQHCTVVESATAKKQKRHLKYVAHLLFSHVSLNNIILFVTGVTQSTDVMQ